MKFNVFISYSTKNLQEVEHLRSILTNTPIEVFIAEHSVAPGEELASPISEAIKKCDLFIVLWSKSAKASDWVSQEIGIASGLNKKILPLVLEKDLNLPGFISNLKYLPLYENLQHGLAEAKKIAEKEYSKKVKSKKEKDSTLAILGLGALLLWATRRN